MPRHLLAVIVEGGLVGGIALCALPRCLPALLLPAHTAAVGLTVGWAALVAMLMVVLVGAGHLWKSKRDGGKNINQLCVWT